MVRLFYLLAAVSFVFASCSQETKSENSSSNCEKCSKGCNKPCGNKDRCDC